MADSNVQLHWTDEQWNKVRQVVYEEARRARVAGNLLPLYGPLEPDASYVAKQQLQELPNDVGFIVSDRDTLRLITIQERVLLRGGQVADPELNSALFAFRRAANRVARREDETVFNGDGGSDDESGALPQETTGPATKGSQGSAREPGLVDSAMIRVRVAQPRGPGGRGGELVVSVSKAIARLERRYQLGPFAVVLGHAYFEDVQRPTDSMVLPQDRILPFLGGGALVRTSVLESEQGLVIALGGAPIDLVVGTDISVSFLQVTPDAWFVFRVYEKIVLRIKQPQAIALLSEEGDDED
jgi:uncharacterized linocin/CFP29 family protein